VRFATRRSDVILTGIDSLLLIERYRFAALASQHRVPAIYEWRIRGGLENLDSRLSGVSA